MNWGRPEWVKRLPSPLVIALATVGSVGRLRPGPGTWGSAVGVLFFGYCLLFVPDAGLLAVGSGLTLLAVPLCGEAEIRLGKKDPGEVVLDEFVAMPFCFIGWESWGDLVPIWAILLAGFAVFRVYDIAKPLGINRLQDLPGGWGVVIDDTAAAFATCVTLHAAAYGWRLATHG